MTLFKVLSTAHTARTLFVHLGTFFFVIFPLGVLVLIIVKSCVSFLFSGFDAIDDIDGFLWIFTFITEDVTLWQTEVCTLMNCTAAFVALVVYMIRVLLKPEELPNAPEGVITLYVRLGFRIVALPLLTVLVCTVSSFAIYLVFLENNLVDTYASLSFIVLLPTAIGTWIWVWRGEWITSIKPTVAPLPEPEGTIAESGSVEND
ncbi:MAG: hypothetical protein F4W92_01540 [Gammaproteobacteria bacterium]|nr:hypothetical protein [Gammaproteobacteria bacterium]